MRMFDTNKNYLFYVFDVKKFEYQCLKQNLKSITNCIKSLDI